MKVPKILTRDPITGAKVLARPYKVAVSPDGELVTWSTAGHMEAPLPAGHRWATDADLPDEPYSNEYTAD